MRTIFGDIVCGDSVNSYRCEAWKNPDRFTVFDLVNAPSCGRSSVATFAEVTYENAQLVHFSRRGVETNMAVMVFNLAISGTTSDRWTFSLFTLSTRI